MYGAHNRLVSLSCQFLKRRDNLNSGLAIKSRGWLVKKDHFWIRDELDSDGSPLALASRDELF